MHHLSWFVCHFDTLIKISLPGQMQHTTPKQSGQHSFWQHQLRSYSTWLRHCHKQLKGRVEMWVSSWQWNFLCESQALCKSLVWYWETIRIDRSQVTWRWKCYSFQAQCCKHKQIGGHHFQSGHSYLIYVCKLKRRTGRYWREVQSIQRLFWSPWWNGLCVCKRYRLHFEPGNQGYVTVGFTGNGAQTWEYEPGF